VVGGDTGAHYRIAMMDALAESPPAGFPIPTVPSKVVLAPPPSSPRPLHILIVEDQVVNQKLLTRMLSRLGHSFAVAANGAIAVAAVQRSYGQPVQPPGSEETSAAGGSGAAAGAAPGAAVAGAVGSVASSASRAGSPVAGSPAPSGSPVPSALSGGPSAAPVRPFDLVLMDVAMPVLDGVEATRAIRLWSSQHRAEVQAATAAQGASGAAAGPSAPGAAGPLAPGAAAPWTDPLVILGLTAHAMLSDTARCRQAGMDQVLHKPCSFNMLAEQIRHWTSKTRAELIEPVEGAPRH